MKNIVKTLVLTGIISWQAQANKENNLSYEKLLPQYVSWAIAIDHKGLKIGISLNKKEILLAKEIGVKYPERVRVIYVDQVPYPYENEHLKQMGLSLGLIGKDIVNEAQVFGYSIYVRKGYEFDRPRMAHELVHVLQIERASFSELLTQHISDLRKFSYENAPLEAEAFKANKKYAIK